jgi:hypothetical protein
MTRFLAVLTFGFIAMAAQAADDEPNYKLVGLTSVRFELFSQLIFGEAENGCKNDRAAWQAALDRAAEQSTKLRLVSHQAEVDEDVKRIQKEEAEGKCSLKVYDDRLPSCFMGHGLRQPMPDLRFFATVAKVENTCVARVEASLRMTSLGTQNLRPRGAIAP